MYVILTQDVPQLGSKNSLTSVKKGHYMNYLMPRGLANVATKGMILRMRDTLVAKKEAKELAGKALNAQAKVLQNAKITLDAKVSAKGTLFRAIAEKTVAKAIMDELSLEVDPAHIVMEHIKKLGEHDVQIKFGADSVGIKVTVVAKEE